MKKRKQSIEDQLTKKLLKGLTPKVKQFEKETDPEKRAKGFHELFPLAFDTMVLEIDKMSDNDFTKLEESRVSELEEITTKVLQEGFKHRLAEGDLQMKDLGLFSKPKFENLKKNTLVNKALRKKKTLGRLYSLELLSRISHQSLIILDRIKLRPITEIEKIVQDRFGFDINWCFASLILAVHENLVKKKLIALNESEDDIERILKKSKFQGLVSHLRKLIEKKEKRKLSLSFYKSPALREIRNKLEHEGYKQPVTTDDALDLLKEIKQFEKELYKEKKTKKKK